MAREVLDNNTKDAGAATPRMMKGMRSKTHTTFEKNSPPCMFASLWLDFIEAALPDVKTV